MVEGGHLVEREKQEAEQVGDVEEKELRVDTISSKEAELRASEEV